MINGLHPCKSCVRSLYNYINQNIMNKQKLFTFIFFGFYEKVKVKNCKDEKQAWSKLKEAFEVSEVTIWKIESICQ